MSCPLANNTKTRAVQPSWAEDYGFVFHKDCAVCTLCFDNVVCPTSSVKRHFETRHERSFRDQADEGESIQRAVSRCGKPTVSKSVKQAFLILNMIVVGAG